MFPPSPSCAKIIRARIIIRSCRQQNFIFLCVYSRESILGIALHKISVNYAMDEEENGTHIHKKNITIDNAPNYLH